MTDDITRRQLLMTAAGAALLASIRIDGSLLAQEVKKLGILVGTSAAQAQLANKNYKIQNNLFVQYNLDTKQLRELEVPLGTSHETLVHPIEKNVALIIEREGPYACLIDMAKMKVIKKFSADPDYFFLGHGIFTPDGEKILIGQYPKGRIEFSNLAVFDYHTLEIQEYIDTGVFAPHELCWFPDKNTLAIGHYGLFEYYEARNLRSGIVIYDFANRKVLSKVAPPIPNVYTCHVQVTNDKKIFGLTHDSIARRDKEAIEIKKLKLDYKSFITQRPNFFDTELRPAPLLVVDASGTPTKISGYQYKHTGDHQRWGLSIVVNEKHRVVAGTWGLGGIVTFQNADTGELVKTHVLEEGENARAAAVTLDGNHFAISLNTGNVAIFNCKNLERVRTEILPKGRFNFVTHMKCIENV